MADGMRVLNFTVCICTLHSPIFRHLCSIFPDSAPKTIGLGILFQISSKWVCTKWAGRQPDRANKFMCSSQEIWEELSDTLLAWPSVKHRMQWSKVWTFPPSEHPQIHWGLKPHIQEKNVKLQKELFKVKSHTAHEKREVTLCSGEQEKFKEKMEWGQAQWLISVITALWKATAGGFLEPRSSRQARAMWGDPVSIFILKTEAKILKKMEWMKIIYIWKGLKAIWGVCVYMYLELCTVHFAEGWLDYSKGN